MAGRSSITYDGIKAKVKEFRKNVHSGVQSFFGFVYRVFAVTAYFTTAILFLTTLTVSSWFIMAGTALFHVALVELGVIDVKYPVHHALTDKDAPAFIRFVMFALITFLPTVIMFTDATYF